MREGKFIATVVRHEFGRSNQKGTPFILIEFDADVDGQPESIHHQIWMTKDSAKIARATLKTLGFNPDKQNTEELDRNPRLLNGNKVVIVVGTETYKDEERWKIKWINPVPKSGVIEEGNANHADLTKLLRDAKSKDDDNGNAAVEAVPGEKEELPF